MWQKMDKQFENFLRDLHNVDGEVSKYIIDMIEGKNYTISNLCYVYV